jgi:DDE family transposase
MPYSTPQQLCFPPLTGYTIRADFEGGALSSDFGALLLRGIDRQIGLTERLAAAMQDKRHPSYIDHPLRDLLAQRIYQIASGYADGNDANSLRHDPLFKLSVERPPLEPTQDLASAPTFSRLEHSVDRKDLYRLTRALIDHFIASYPEPPAALVLDLDHSADPTHGQQEFAFYNHHYRSYCYLPLFIFEGTSHALVTACLRPGKRPPGTENAMILVRLLACLRFGRQCGVTSPRSSRHARGTLSLPAASRPRAGPWRAPSRQQSLVCRVLLCCRLVVPAVARDR